MLTGFLNEAVRDGKSRVPRLVGVGALSFQVLHVLDTACQHDQEICNVCLSLEGDIQELGAMKSELMLLVLVAFGVFAALHIQLYSHDCPTAAT